MPWLTIALLACATSAPTADPEPDAPMAPPETRRVDVVDDYHGTAVADPYRWLEDPDEAEVMAWVKAQSAHTEAWLAEVPERPRIRQRLEALWSHARRSVPRPVGEHWWFEHNDGLQAQPRILRADAPDGPGEVMLDPNTLSDDGTVAVMQWLPSPDGTKLAYTLSDGGTDWRTIHVRDLTSGDDLPEVLTHAKFTGLAWMPDSSALLYSRYDSKEGELASTQQKVFAHRLGTDPADDTLVIARPEAPEQGFGAYRTHDGDYVVLEVWEGSAEDNRVFVLPLRHTGRPPRQLEARRTAPRQFGQVRELLPEPDARYHYVANEGRTFVFHTTRDAPRGRIVSIDLDHAEPDAWAELVPSSDDTLESAHRVGDHLFLVYLRDAASVVKVVPLAGGTPTELPLPGVGTVEGFHGGPGDDRACFQFTSYTQPASLYCVPADASAPPEAVWAPEVPFDPSDYRTEQIFVTSKDGTRVPVFLSYKGALERTGDRPTLLYGYGGFNIPLSPGFSASNLVWMEMGGVLAVANLRGGGEYGAEWHDAGRLANKQNVFDDFIASAEHLIAEGITSTPKLATYGRSNGGLLVGATLVQRPDLFGAAMPAVGVLDMLRFHRWTIGWAWKSDYGSSEDPAMFPVLHGYSPLHNAVPADYPPTMVMTADHDDRVVPAHSFKFGAALQHAQQGDAPVLLRIETRAGHGAGKSTAMRIDEAADQWAFLVRALDLTLPKG